MTKFKLPENSLGIRAVGLDTYGRLDLLFTPKLEKGVEPNDDVLVVFHVGTEKFSPDIECTVRRYAPYNHLNTSMTCTTKVLVGVDREAQVHHVETIGCVKRYK